MLHASSAKLASEWEVMVEQRSPPICFGRHADSCVPVSLGQGVWGRRGVLTQEPRLSSTGADTANEGIGTLGDGERKGIKIVTKDNGAN